MATATSGADVLEDVSTPSEPDAEDPVAVRGVVTPENTVLDNGEFPKHYFMPEMAKPAAEALEEQIVEEPKPVHIVKNFHDSEGGPSAGHIIGKVTAASYSEGVGVRFGGEIVDPLTAAKIERGYLTVSPVYKPELGDYDESMQACRVATFWGYREIAVVGHGQPGTSIEVVDTGPEDTGNSVWQRLSPFGRAD